LLHGALEGSVGGFTVSLQGVHLMAENSAARGFQIEAGKAHVFDVETGLRRTGHAA
jgi:sn-glycerol 3-phosphate transport system ATP-binding protein